MIYIIIFIVLLLVEIAYFRIANHYDIIDKPNQRSSHSVITLRGGGLIFYIAFILYFCCFGFQYLCFFIGLTMISMISFADDIKPQSTKLRLLVHFFSMILMFYQWELFLFPWYFWVMALVFCIGFINAFNFMDGINGITGGYSSIIVVAFWYINNYQFKFIDNELIYTVLLSILVFNFFNFRKQAKCFAGDVGAVSIAFILIFLLGKLIIFTHDFSYILLFVVYGVDSILTIIHRLILKENIFHAHRKHVFQLLANELKISHVNVSLIYMFIQALVIVGLVSIDSKYNYSIAVIVFLSACYVLIKKRYYSLHN